MKQKKLSEKLKNINNRKIVLLKIWTMKTKEELDVEYMDLGEYYYHDGEFDEDYDIKTPSVEFKDKVLEFKINNTLFFYKNI